MIAELGWKEGQRLQFSVSEEGKIIIKAVPYANGTSEQENT
jgi:bifunctional DNA-binding transcriptional regulator/antitoxin component of YhaV-PrlF toxin-antitoxin module